MQINPGFSDHALKSALYPLIRSNVEITINRVGQFQVTLEGDTKLGFLSWSYNPEPIPTDPVVLAKDIAKRVDGSFKGK